MILVIGARSRTGRELVRLLRSAGIPLRLLTRSPEVAERANASNGMADGTADGTSDAYVVGDIARPASLDAAMDGVDKVFLLTSPHHDERAWHVNAVDAAARAGVTHLVRSSILGADPRSHSRFIRHHGLVDAHLADSNVPWTILRPNYYLHNVTSGWAPTLDAQGTYYAPAGDARLSMVDARDVAAVAFAALTDSGHAGRVHDITGPEALGHADAAALLGEHLGRPVRYVPVDDATAKDALHGAGVNAWMSGALIELYQDYRRSGTDGYAAQVTSTVQDVTGTRARSLRDALADAPEHTPAAAPAGTLADGQDAPAPTPAP